MHSDALKVGELARRTGLTVRTLHHYDEIGLLKPSLHTASGYRLYTGGDIARLQQVVSLRQLGLSLEEIKGCLDGPGFSPTEVIDLHLARLREQIESQRRLCERFEAIAIRLRSAGGVSADEFLRAIEETVMIETYFTPEQLERMQRRRAEVGEEGLRAKMAEWKDLIAEIKSEMSQGTDPADARVQTLARRWQGLVEFTTNGDPAMAQAIRKHWEEDGDKLVAQHGAEYDSRPVWGYMEEAIRQGAPSPASGEDPTVRDHEGGGGGVDRRGFLTCLACASAGLVGSAGDRALGQETTRPSFASFDGTRIAYSDEGDGPAVILLHGFGVDGAGNFGPFDRLLPKLERTNTLLRERFGAAPPLPSPPPEGRPGLAACLRKAGARVIVPDMRGFGASDKPRDAKAYADAAMARDVIALAGHLKLDAFDVLGFSMGSVTAAKLLVLGSPHVRSAVLAGVGSYILEGEMMELPKGYPVPDGLTQPFTMRAHAEALARSLDDAVKPESPSSVLVRSTGGDPAVLAAVVRGSVAEQVPVEPLRKVKAAVLVLNGKADLANQAVGKLLEAIPNSRSTTCDGDHHTSPWYPSFQRAVVDFLSARWPSRRGTR